MRQSLSPAGSAYPVLLVAALCGGCTVLTVADAAVSVVATAASVGATVVGTTVDVAAAGVKAATKSADEAPTGKK